MLCWPLLGNCMRPVDPIHSIHNRVVNFLMRLCRILDLQKSLLILSVTRSSTQCWRWRLLFLPQFRLPLRWSCPVMMLLWIVVLYPHLMVRRNSRLLLKLILLVMLKPFFVFSLQVTCILELFIRSYGFYDRIYHFPGAYIGDVNMLYGQEFETVV